MNEKWYRADFEAAVGEQHDDVAIDSEFFQSVSDESAIAHARELARMGVDFADVGHVETELVQVCEVDDTAETWNELRVVYC